MQHCMTNHLGNYANSPTTANYQVGMLYLVGRNLFFFYEEVSPHLGDVHLARLKVHCLQNPLIDLDTMSCSVDVR